MLDMFLLRLGQFLGGWMLLMLIIRVGQWLEIDDT